MKYFCSKCGKTTQYNFELPKFCAFCGQSFANKPASKETVESRDRFLNELKLKKNLNSSILEKNLLDDSEFATEENNKFTDFKKVKPTFQLDVYQSKGESFGNIIDNPAESVASTNSNINIKSKEDVLLEFQQEAGALRSK